MKTCFLRLMLAVVVWSAWVPAAQASRIASVFLHDLDRAQLIVQGEVVDSWHATSLGIGCAYRMRVDKWFKGKLEAGQDVVVWDENGTIRLANGSRCGSTGSWGIRDKGGYIFYAGYQVDASGPCI